MTDPYDSDKNRKNIIQHDISFERIKAFGWDDCVTVLDDRFDYGEDRFISYGHIDERLYVLVWILRNDEIRPISLRKANARERKRYE